MKFKKNLAVVLASIMLLCSVPLAELAGFAAENLPEISLGLFAKAQETEITDETVTTSGTCGENLTWVLYENGTLVISGEGEMDDDYDNTPWYAYRDYIITVIIKNDVTSIGESAFSNCDSLTNITIPDSVTSIGDYAFYICDSLTSITIPDSVTSIGDYAFAYCYSLTSITIADSVTSIGDYAFSDCYSLTSITVDENNTQYSSDSYGVLFNKNKTELIRYPCDNETTSYSIPDSVTNIRDCAFYICDSLTSITIPDSVTSIGVGAFSDCYSLTSITIADSVTSIGDYAFSDCYSLTSITIGDSVTSIGYGAFSNCDSLTNITIPDSVTSIGYDAFRYCDSLETITILNPECEIADKGETIYSGATIVGYLDSTAQEYAEKYDREFELIDDEAHEHNFDSVVTEPTCTEDGYTTYTCTDCGYSYKDTYVDATGHTDENNDNTCEVCGNNVSDILVGETKLIDIVANEITYLRFIPERSGKYTFYSSADSNTYGYLFDADKNQLASNDDAGEDLNFSITYELEAGKTYYWGARLYSYESGSFDVTLEYICTHSDADFDGICDNCGESSIIASGTCGENLTWTVYSDTLVISGEGDMYDYDYNNTPWYAYRDYIITVIIKNDVTSIGDYAFSDCDSLTSITIPDSVTSIGVGAFSYCYSLTNITIPDSVTSIGDYAFYVCSSLESITIPDSITTIGDSAFDFCKNLKKISIGKSVTSIGGTVTGVGDEAFRGCLSLESIMVDVNNAYYSSDAYGVLFDKNKTILIRYPAGNARTEYFVPDSVITIDDYAFEYCANLESITMPDSVISIGYAAFTDCSSLISITIPDSLTIIRNMTFRYCTNLESIIIPNSITSIGPNAFTYCSNLESITILNPECEIYDSSYTIYSGTKIIGYADSTAQAYAEKYEREFELIGDEAHEHNFDSVVTEPTCTEDGYTTYTCKDCGYSYTDSVEDAFGHDPVSYTQSATCEVTGYTITTCSRCYEELDFEILDKLGHDWDDGVVITEATCIVKEEKLYTCKNDASHTNTETGEVNPENHQGETYVDNVKTVSCTEDGYTGDTFCSDCNERLVNGEVIEKLGHDMCAWEVLKAATLLEEGQEKSKCTRCDHTETRIIPRLEGKKTEDEQSGVSVEYTSDAYDEDVVIKIEEVYNGSQYLTQQYTNIMSWNIKTYIGDTEVQPDAPVLVRIPLPASYNTSTIAVYHINSETGKRERVLPVTIEDGYICFLANSFSVYILVDESSSITNEPGVPSDSSADCDHMCHKSGFMGFIWKIVRFFWKLFKMNPVCECGAVHY